MSRLGMLALAASVLTTLPAAAEEVSFVLEDTAMVARGADGAGRSGR
jgi:hypothetical protein